MRSEMLWPCDMLGRSSRDRQRAVHGGRPPPADRGRRSTAGTIHPTGPLEWEAIHFPSSSLRPLRNGKTLFYERIWPMARCNARPKTRQIRNEEVRKHGLLSASGNCWIGTLSHVLEILGCFHRVSVPLPLFIVPNAAHNPAGACASPTLMRLLEAY